MQPFDIALWVVVAIAVMAAVWLVANARRKASSRADFIATWAASWLLAFVIGGGLMMFGVAVLYFLFGQPAAMAGLVLLVLVLIAEPFILAAAVFRRRKVATR